MECIQRWDSIGQKATEWQQTNLWQVNQHFGDLQCWDCWIINDFWRSWIRSNASNKSHALRTWRSEDSVHDLCCLLTLWQCLNNSLNMQEGSEGLKRLSQSSSCWRRKNSGLRFHSLNMPCFTFHPFEENLQEPFHKVLQNAIGFNFKNNVDLCADSLSVLVSSHLFFFCQLNCTLSLHDAFWKWFPL